METTLVDPKKIEMIWQKTITKEWDGCHSKNDIKTYNSELIFFFQGDLTKQLAIREKLQCKSFKWFMNNVAFDLPKRYPPGNTVTTRLPDIL